MPPTADDVLAAGFATLQAFAGYAGSYRQRGTAVDVAITALAVQAITPFAIVPELSVEQQQRRATIQLDATVITDPGKGDLLTFSTPAFIAGTWQVNSIGTRDAAAVTCECVLAQVTHQLAPGRGTGGG